MKKMLFASLLVIAVVVVACAAAPTATPTAAPTATKAPAAAPTAVAATPTKAPATGGIDVPAGKMVSGIETGADIDKAKKEGKVVWYSAEREMDMNKIQETFNKKFEGIDARSSYLREQTGRLYAKLVAERDAGQFIADVVNLTDLAIVMDAQKKGIYDKYLSPQLKNIDKTYMSDPPGLFTWNKVQVGGISYNPDKTKPEDAPKTYKDIMNAKWAGRVNHKDSASGMQFAQWFAMRKLFGNDYWTQYAKAVQPKCYASTAQQFEKIISGEDLVNGMAQHSTFVTEKAKGSPVAYVIPPEGVSMGWQIMGVATKAPHPESAKLFVDYALSQEGQDLWTDLVGDFSTNKLGKAPQFLPKLSDIKLILPDSWEETLASTNHALYIKEWNQACGL